MSKVSVTEIQREFLEDRMDSDFGLVDKLYANSTLTKGELHDVKEEKTSERRNKKLLHLILQKNKEDKLVGALRDTGQTHLVNYLNSDGVYNRDFSDDWPLGDREVGILRINYERLVELLYTYQLFLILYAREVINSKQYSYIYSIADEARKSEVLLDILGISSLRKYKTTIECLHESKQSHVAEILSEGGVIVRIHANSKLSTGAGVQIGEAEVQIVTAMANLLADRPPEEVILLMDLTQHRLFAVRKVDSINLFFACMTLKQINYLHDSLLNGQLKVIVQKVFQQFLVSVNVITLSNCCSEEEYSGQKLYLTGLTGGYRSDPLLVQTIKTKEDKNITGMTILQNELFVMKEKSSKVEVYDAVNFNFIRLLTIDQLMRPRDMASSNDHKCLYIIGFRGTASDQSNEIERIDRNGKLINKWKINEGSFYCSPCSCNISITDESNVLATIEYDSKLIEYSPDGQLICQIKLSPDSGIKYPTHAVKLTSGQYVVIHAVTIDDLHRACLVDVDGNVISSFGGKVGSDKGQMNLPSYFAVDEDGSIMVADQLNKRVLLLSYDLEFQREILSRVLIYPQKIYLGRSSRQLFVVSYNKVLIYKIK